MGMSNAQWNHGFHEGWKAAAKALGESKDGVTTIVVAGVLVGIGIGIAGAMVYDALTSKDDSSSNKRRSS